MDEIYVNAEEITSHDRSFKREPKSSEDTSVNHEVIQTVRLQTTRPGLPGVEIVKKSSCIAATILLALLCFFLLTGLITLGFLFTKDKSQWETKGVVLQELYDNVTRERNQLQASYNNMTTQRDQLQASHIRSIQERDQLQKRLEVMTKDRDNLQALMSQYYYVSTTVKTWQDSRQDCVQRGADLMIVNSQEELNFANSFNKYLWLGMTDAETEGTWKWVDGTPVTTSYWTGGEPNGGTNENCGQIRSYYLPNSWNDESCFDSCFWICEKRVSP